MKTLTQLKPEIAHFLHPETGVERGLFHKKDADEKVIGITCGELRRLGSLLRNLNHLI